MFNQAKPPGLADKEKMGSLAYKQKRVGFTKVVLKACDLEVKILYLGFVYKLNEQSLQNNQNH